MQSFSLVACLQPFREKYICAFNRSVWYWERSDRIRPNTERPTQSKYLSPHIRKDVPHQSQNSRQNKRSSILLLSFSSLPRPPRQRELGQDDRFEVDLNWVWAAFLPFQSVDCTCAKTKGEERAAKLGEQSFLYVMRHCCGCMLWGRGEQYINRKCSSPNRACCIDEDCTPLACK